MRSVYDPPFTARQFNAQNYLCIMAPTPNDVLSWIAAASPSLPRRHFQEAGIATGVTR